MQTNDRFSILILLMGSVGDVARGIVLTHQIKTQRPDCRITWLVEPKSHAVVELHSGIDEIILFERGKGLPALIGLFSKLRSQRFDVVLDLQRHAKSGLFSWLSGAPRRIGFHRTDAKEGNWLFSTETIPALGESIPKIRHYLAFLQPLGLEIIEPFDFGLRTKAELVALPDAFPVTYESPRIGLLLGSAWRSKDWVAEGYDQLISLILNRLDSKVFLLGDKSVAPLAERLISAHNNPRLLSFAGKTSLRELIGIIANIDLICGPDSGPGHIAAALGVPYVGLFGATDPERTAPFGSEALVVRGAVGCSPCYRRECPGLNRVCMRLISPSAVFERIRAVLHPQG